MGTSTTSEVISLGMRMVVRMRHEFGCSIDVMNLLHDRSYATSVIEMARRSTSEQLREQAACLEQMLLGPRDRSVPVPSVPAAAPSTHDVDDAQRRRTAAMSKYRMGLR